jgi:integrase
MGNYPSLIHFALTRLDSLMAIGSSRHQAKIALREASEEKPWTVSTGKIFSHSTRKTYQQQVLAFINWVKATYQINRPAHLDERADELVAEYLRKGIAEGKSPYTLQTQRSALRLFFGWQVAASVELPRRTQEAITRSRLPAKHDKNFQPNNWPTQVLFARATGLRRAELRDLRIREVYTNECGQLVVYVKNGKGGKSREVPVLPEYAQDVLEVIQGREPEEHVFDHIPTAMDVQSYRRGSAQVRYQHHALQRPLPPARGRLKPTDYDASAAKKVSKALGHQRKSIVLNHYLR